MAQVQPGSSRCVRINAVTVAAAWILWSGYWVVVGWVLSLFGALNHFGYAIAAGVLLGALAVLSRTFGGRLRLDVRPNRWRRGWPLAFLVLASAAFIGAACFQPTNIDALTYRLPRVMHWLAAGRWQWIETNQLRMNYSGVGAEWLAAPWLALTGSARLLWLLSMVSFLLVPGLLFAWLCGLGVGAKVAWRWMWVAPTALGFALQAGSVGNDLLGATYILAGLVFAQRAARDGDMWWFVLAVGAIALATNVKASNLALVPMWLATIGTAGVELLRRRPLTTVMAVVAGVLVSIAPTLWLNRSHTGDWTGDPENRTAVRAGSPVAALVGNGVLFSAQNLAPPFWPVASTWNRQVVPTLDDTLQRTLLRGGFPRFTLRLGEMPQEEWAGVGLAFVLVGCVEVWLSRRNSGRCGRKTRMVLWAGGIGFLIFSATVASEMPARLTLPFMFVPIGAIAVGAPDGRGDRSPLWRIVAALAFATALLAVAATPARPLFPASRVFAVLSRRWPGNVVVERAAHVYRVYANRFDVLAPVRADLPVDVRRVGFLATDDDSDWSLWLRPNAGVVDVLSLTDPRLQDIRVLVARAEVFGPEPNAARMALAAAGFQIRSEHLIEAKASRPPERWLVAVRSKAGS